MTPKQREAWNQRTLTVKIWTKCESCGSLKDDVQAREHTGFYPKVHTVKQTCCAGCFEIAKTKARGV